MKNEGRIDTIRVNNDALFFFFFFGSVEVGEF